MLTIGVTENFWINVIILVAIGAAVFLTNQPEALLGLFALRDIPIQAFEAPAEIEDEESPPIGFVHH